MRWSAETKPGYSEDGYFNRVLWPGLAIGGGLAGIDREPRRHPFKAGDGDHPNGGGSGLLRFPPRRLNAALRDPETDLSDLPLKHGCNGRIPLFKWQLSQFATADALEGDLKGFDGEPEDIPEASLPEMDDDSGLRCMNELEMMEFLGCEDRQDLWKYLPLPKIPDTNRPEEFEFSDMIHVGMKGFWTPDLDWELPLMSHPRRGFHAWPFQKPQAFENVRLADGFGSDYVRPHERGRVLYNNPALPFLAFDISPNYVPELFDEYPSPPADSHAYFGSPDFYFHLYVMEDTAAIKEYDLCVAACPQIHFNPSCPVGCYHFGGGFHRAMTVKAMPDGEGGVEWVHDPGEDRWGTWSWIEPHWLDFGFGPSDPKPSGAHNSPMFLPVRMYDVLNDGEPYNGRISQKWIVTPYVNMDLKTYPEPGTGDSGPNLQKSLERFRKRMEYERNSSFSGWDYPRLPPFPPPGYIGDTSHWSECCANMDISYNNGMAALQAAASFARSFELPYYDYDPRQKIITRDATPDEKRFVIPFVGSSKRQKHIPHVIDADMAEAGLGEEGDVIRVETDFHVGRSPNGDIRRKEDLHGDQS